MRLLLDCVDGYTDQCETRLVQPRLVIRARAP